MDRNDPLVRQLLEEETEFKELYREHEELEQKLARLDSIHYLSPEQEMERRQLQKIKLMGRDRMEIIMRQRREGAAGT